MELSKITEAIIGAAIQVNKRVGPGLLESAHEACLAFELSRIHLNVEQQKALPLIYDSVKLDCGYRLDLLVQDQLIVEVKAEEHVLPVHKMQLLSYLRLSGRKVGLVINFHQPTLTTGIHRLVNNF